MKANLALALLITANSMAIAQAQSPSEMPDCTHVSHQIQACQQPQQTQQAQPENQYQLTAQISQQQLPQLQRQQDGGAQQQGQMQPRQRQQQGGLQQQGQWQQQLQIQPQQPQIQCQQQQYGNQADRWAASEANAYESTIRAYESCLHDHPISSINCVTAYTCTDQCLTVAAAEDLAPLANCINHEMTYNIVTPEGLRAQILPIVQKRLRFINPKMTANLLWSIGKVSQ